MNYYEFMSPDDFTPVTHQDNDKASADAQQPNPSLPSLDVDHVLESIQSSEWGSRLGSFFGQVKKQSSVYIDATRKDLESFAQTAKRDLGELTSQVKQETSATVSAFKSINHTNSNLKSISSGISSLLKDAVHITAPEDSSDDSNIGGTSFSRKQKKIIINRREALLHKLYTDPTAFTDDPAVSSAPDTVSKFTEFQSTFHIEEMTDDTAHQLELYPELREMMESLVPEKIPYKTFWLRYYYHFWLIDEDEKRRKELLKATTAADENQDEELFSWEEDNENESDVNTNADLDEQEEKPQVNKSIPASVSATAIASTSTVASPRDSSDGSSYDVVSRSSVATGTDKNDSDVTIKKVIGTPLKTTTRDDWDEWE